MNTMSFVDESENQAIEKPGALLALIREKKGYTPEYVAEKLHLRKRVIELLEADIYDQLPQAVFVKGYIRSYAKFLGVDAEPIVTLFSHSCVEVSTPERTLWQTRREPNINERLARWVTGCIVVVSLLALTFWWQKNNKFATHVLHNMTSSEVKTSQPFTGTHLTEVSKIKSLFRNVDTTRQDITQDEVEKSSD